MKDNRPKIALVCHDHIGAQMAGPGIRYFEMAKILAKDFRVLLLAPQISDLADKYPEIEFAVFDTRKSTRSIFSQVADCSCIIAQSLRPTLLYKIKRAGIYYIADLYDPLVIETLEYFKFDSKSYRKIIFNFHLNFLLLQLAGADAIACASDRQRNFYLGMMFDHGIVNPVQYQKNPTPDSNIFLLPFGFKREGLKADDSGILEKNYPKINKNDFIVYWGGGVWNWFDPLSVIKAIEKISKKRSDIKLFFLGVKHPNPNIKGMEVAEEILEYCQKNDLLDKSVFFNFGWTPYEERKNYLARANIGVSAHLDNLETHFSFRTRILDYLWADKPMVLSRGDVLAEFAENNHLGIIVESNNPDQIAEAILRLANDKKLYETMRGNIRKEKTCFYWETILQKLSARIENGHDKIIPLGFGQFVKFSLNFYYYGLRKKFTKNKSG